MLIIGHRGAKGLAPENTLDSIRAALACNVDAIEIDVRLHDNTVVLSHDETLQTKTYTPLAEAIELVNGKLRLIIEIKERAVVEPLLEVLQGYTGPVTFSCKKYNKYDILQTVKKQLPKAHVAVTDGWSSLRAVSLASLLKTKEIHLNEQWLWSGVVRSLKHRGYTVFAYTVNTEERAHELAEWGVDGIFTDFPDRVKP